MPRLAEWLLFVIWVAPVMGLLSALIGGLSLEPRRSIFTKQSVRVGAMVSCLASLLLAALLGELLGPCFDVVSWRWGEAFAITGPSPFQSAWSLRADLVTAVWATLVAGLSWRIVTRTERQIATSASPAVLISLNLVLISVMSLTLSGSLLQLVCCWSAVSFSTWFLVGMSTRNDEATSAIRRAVLIGMTTDGFLYLAVLLLSVNGQTLILDDLISTAGLMKLSERNPALPGFIGSLFVLGVLGRSGLFPCFGWHRKAELWIPPAWLMVYLVAYVPSSFWLLWRFHPIVASSEVSLTLLGGLGSLGAVLGSYVACGQDSSKRAAAYLVTAQWGVMFAALSCGLLNPELLSRHAGGPEAVLRIGDLWRAILGQLAVVVGAIMVWRGSRRTNQNAAREASLSPMTQLSRERLYVDALARCVLETPLQWMSQAAQFVERRVFCDMFSSPALRMLDWCGHRIEALQLRQREFDLSATLLGIVTVLLTLILVS